MTLTSSATTTSPAQQPAESHTPRHTPLRLPRVALLLTLLTSLSAHALTVSIQGGFAGVPGITDSTGSTLPTGHKVSVGTFADGFDPAAPGTDLPSILQNWRQLGFTTTSVVHGSPGAVSLTTTSPEGYSPEGFHFPGKRVFILLTLTTTPFTEPLPDASNVKEFAIFTGDPTLWIYPVTTPDTLPGEDLAEFYFDGITTAIGGSIDPATGLLALTTYSTSPDGPSAFDQWLAATFGQNSTVSPDSIVGPAGLSALATFALNSSPDSTAPPYTTVSDESTGRIGIEFTRKKPSVSGFATHAQACTDLSSWALPVAESVIAETDTAETVRAFPVFPDGADTSKAFFRIRVEPIN